MAHLDNIFERFDPNQNLDFETLKDCVRQSIANDENIDIVIDDAVKNRLANIFVLQELIDQTEKDIRIFTTDVGDAIYGTPAVRWSLEKWLNADATRRLYILLKEYIDLNTRKFSTLFGFLEYRDQVYVRSTTLPDIQECEYNCFISDMKRYKIKHTSNNLERVIFNFNDTESATKLATDFEYMFGEEVTTKLRLPANEFSLVEKLQHFPYQMAAYIRNLRNSDNENMKIVDEHEVRQRAMGHLNDYCSNVERIAGGYKRKVSTPLHHSL